jgi:hypothetical protein
MNNLPREKQIDIIAALAEGMSIRSVERLTGVHRDTIMRLGARVGRGCAELHDRMMVGLRVPRIECDELWAYVGCKQKRVTRANIAVKGDQYTYVALAASTKAIIAYLTGKRDGENTDLFIRDLRERVLGAPEISTNRSRAGGDSRRAGRDQHQLRRAQQPLYPDGLPAVRAPDKRILEEAREPRGGRELVRGALQSLPRP